MTTQRDITDAAVESAARSGGKVTQRQFEKDYYVTRALRVVFERLPERVVFKGGTSLSKAYKLIDRFSEDIDLLVVPVTDDPAEVDGILNQIVQAAEDAVGIASEQRRSEPGLARDVQLVPPYTTKKDGMSRTIRVEAGRRGGPNPHEVRSIEPLMLGYIPELGDNPDFASFDTTVLHPARTMLEKLFAIKELGEQLLAGETKVPSRKARHFYDVFHLLGPESPTHALLDGNYVTEIVRDCEEHSRRWFGSTAEGFEGSFADLPAFREKTLRPVLVNAYQATCAELCGPGAVIPDWDEIVARVDQHRTVLTIPPA